MKSDWWIRIPLKWVVASFYNNWNEIYTEQKVILYVLQIVFQMFSDKNSDI